MQAAPLFNPDHTTPVRLYNGQNMQESTVFTIAQILNFAETVGCNSIVIRPYYRTYLQWDAYYLVYAFNLPTLAEYHVGDGTYNSTAEPNLLFQSISGSTGFYEQCKVIILRNDGLTHNNTVQFNTITTQTTVDSVDYLQFSWDEWDPQTQPFIFATNANIGTLYINGESPVTYEWTSFPAISGAPGIMALTQITDEGIEPYNQTKIQVSKDNILRFTDGSNIRRLVSNIAQNTWTSIGYSGLNYIQINWHDSTQYQNAFEYTLRFVNHYGEGNNQYYSTVYEVSDSILYDGTEDMYIGFIIDRENQVAVYDPVLHINNPQEPLTHDTVSYNLYRPTEQQMAALYYFLLASDDEPTDEDDPYATGSTDDGGDGSPDQPQDHLVQNNLPTKGGLNLGMVTLYQPSDTELSNIASYLWSDDVLENFKKYFNNFADNLIALMIMPYTMPNLPTKKFKVGNLESDNPLLAAVSYVSDRYVDIDMGKFSLQRKWDSYLDCAPYTKLEIFLPYCGTHTLDTDEIMYPANLSGFIPAADQKNAYVELSLSYRLDILTGNIVATLSVDGELRYQFTGKCGVTVPLTGANYQSLISTIISAGAGLASTIASGGATAPLIASAAVTGTVMSQKPQVYRSGNFSGDISALGYDTPYLIKTRPNKPLLEKQELYTGLPSYKKGTLGEFSGYTEVIEAHIDNVSCTSEERDMIMTALKGGVII